MAGEPIAGEENQFENADGIREVDWINGAFIMAKKESLEKPGLLDEDFFLYAEEIEWCSRIRKFGKICIYGNLHAIHLQGETANQAFDSSGKGYYNLHDRKGRQILVSNFLRIRKQFGRGWFLFHVLCYFAEIPFFFLLVLIRTILFIRMDTHFRNSGDMFLICFTCLVKPAKSFVISHISTKRSDQ
jgi:GT2 family glycosyltransferase